jgi:hypothetical protein
MGWKGVFTGRYAPLGRTDKQKRFIILLFFFAPAVKSTAVTAVHLSPFSSISPDEKL